LTGNLPFIAQALSHHNAGVYGEVRPTNDGRKVITNGKYALEKRSFNATAQPPPDAQRRL
jgi:hypothetical protein